MIQYRTGDVIEAFENGEIDVLVHGCNACGVMGSGIAKSIKMKFPEAYAAYKNMEELTGLNMGSWSYFVTQKGGRIVNLITQDKYLPRSQRHFSYDHFADSFGSLLSMYRGKKIGLPMIGAGLAGGEWDIIEAIINNECKKFNTDVYVYKLEPPKTSKSNDLG